MSHHDELLRVGYVVVPKAIRLPVGWEQERDQELTTDTDQWHHIFNRNSIANDSTKRLQRRLLDTDVCLKNIFSQVIQMCTQWFPNHHARINSRVVLYSKAGCKQQRAHADFIPEDMSFDLKNNPIGCLVAIYPNTRFCVWQGMFGLQTWSQAQTVSTIHLQTGDILFFRGDLVHAGAAYSSDHFRLHMVLDGPTNVQRKNVSWIIRHPAQTTHSPEFIVE